MKNEIWISIKNYENKYMISSFGRVKSLNYNNTKTEKILKTRYNRTNREYVNLSINGKYTSFMIHKLVMDNFCPNDILGIQVNHIDGNCKNNKIENLEWVSGEDNIEHAKINFLFAHNSRNSKTILKYYEVLEIRKKYKSGNYTHKSLSEEYHVSKSHVTNIINNKKRIIPEI